MLVYLLQPLQSLPCWLVLLIYLHFCHQASMKAAGCRKQLITYGELFGCTDNFASMIVLGLFETAAVAGDTSLPA